jgi:thymidylate synthase
MDQMANDRDAEVRLNNVAALTKLLAETLYGGLETSPRGFKIREKFDTQIEIHPSYPFQGWKARNYDVDYFRAEMRWKLGANRFDDSIMQHAKMWKDVQNPDGSFNSNYGQFWFGSQMGFFVALQELARDRDTRRACIPMLNASHLGPEVKDTVCTESVTFHIRDFKLRMSVHMRSSDQIFGLGTDIPTFSVLMMLMHACLQEYYPGLELGTITLTAASSHIYERHFKMVKEIIDAPYDTYKHIRLPRCTGPSEAMSIIASRGHAHSASVPVHWNLYRFIMMENAGGKA